MLTSAVALVVLLVPLGLLIESTDSAGVNWAAGSSAGRLFTHIRSSVPHALLDLVVLVAAVAVVVLVVLARRRADIGRLFARQWPLFFTACWLVVPVAAVVMLSLVDRPLLVVRYLMVSLPAGDPARRARRSNGCRPSPVVVRPRSRPCCWSSWSGSPLVGVGAVVLPRRPPGLPVARGLHRRSGPTGRRRARSSRPYERMPVEWYMDDQPAAETDVHPVYPATAWGVNPLAFDGSVPLTGSAVERAASEYQRIWVLSATADLSLYPAEAASVDAALRRAGFTPAGTRVFRGVQVTEEVRQ